MAGWQFRTSVDEAFLNTVIQAIRVQRPALFNHATRNIGRKSGLCKPLDSPANGARPYTEIEPFSFGEANGMRLLMDYCYQLSALNIDFRPASGGGDPDFRITAELCVGLGVSDSINVFDMALPRSGAGGAPPRDEYIDYRDLKCFCTRIVLDGTANFVEPFGETLLVLQVTDIEIDDCDSALLNLIECIIKTALNAYILPQAAFAFEPILIAAPDGFPADISLELAPSTSMTNPEFANNALTVHLTIN